MAAYAPKATVALVVHAASIRGETLHMAGMARNRRLARAVAGAGSAAFIRFPRSQLCPLRRAKRGPDPGAARRADKAALTLTAIPARRGISATIWPAAGRRLPVKAMQDRRQRRHRSKVYFADGTFNTAIDFRMEMREAAERRKK